jgi:hypothetical protein
VELEHQSESNSVTAWTPSLWKPPHAMLHWEKVAWFLPTASACSKPAYVSTDRTNKWVPHSMQNSPIHPGNIKQHSPWAGWLPPNKTEKQTANCNQTWTVEGVGVWNAEPVSEKRGVAKN